MANIFSGIMEGLQFSENKRRQAKTDDFEQHRALAEDAIRQTQLKYEGQRIDNEQKNAIASQSETKGYHASLLQQRQETIDATAQQRIIANGLKKYGLDLKSLTSVEISALNATKDKYLHPEDMIGSVNTVVDGIMKDRKSNVVQDAPANDPQSPPASPQSVMGSAPPVNPMMALLGGGQQGTAAAPPAAPVPFNKPPDSHSKYQAGVALAEAHTAVAQGALDTQKSANNLRAIQGDLAKVREVTERNKDKREEKGFPLEEELKRADLRLKNAKTYESQKAAGHLIEMTKKTIQETVKLTDETNFARVNQGTLNALQSKLGTNGLAAYKGTSGAAIQKMKSDSIHQFNLADKAATAAVTKREHTIGEISKMKTAYDKNAGLLLEATKSDGHTASDGKHDWTLDQLKAEDTNLRGTIDEMQSGAELLLAHSQELEEIRYKAKNQMINVQQALKDAGVINDKPPSVKHAQGYKPGHGSHPNTYGKGELGLLPVSFNDGKAAVSVAQAAKMSQSQLRARNGITATKEVRGPGSHKAAPKKAGKKKLSQMSTAELHALWGTK